MVRLASIVCVAALTGQVGAFTSTPFGISKKHVSLYMSDEPAVEEATEVETAPVATPRPSSGLKITEVRKSISSLTTDNFSQTLSTIEPFLLNDAGTTFYAKSMKRISVQAKALGVEVPTGYALDAAATEKRRVKQDAFIKTKEEERLAAEADSAEAEATAENAEEETDIAAETEAVVDEAVEDPAQDLVEA